MPNGRILQIYRDGRRREERQLIQLPRGAQGNLRTLAEMGEIVAHDCRQPDVRRFALDACIGSDHRQLSLDDKIERAFQYCRDAIVYRPEPAGYETLADLWSCLYAVSDAGPTGDCAIKSVALATVFCSLNLRPFFVALKQIAHADYFNHVFVGLDNADGKGWTAYDPTPPEFRPGDLLDSRVMLHYRFRI